MNSFLFKIVNNDTNVFMLCKIREETLSHLPWECPFCTKSHQHILCFCNTRENLLLKDLCTCTYLILELGLRPNCKNSYSNFLVLHRKTIFIYYIYVPANYIWL